MLYYYATGAWHSISGGAVNVDTDTITQNQSQQLTLAQGVTGDTTKGIQIANLMFQLQSRVQNAEVVQRHNAFLPITGIGGYGWMFYPPTTAPATPTYGACVFTMSGDGHTYTFTETADGLFTVQKDSDTAETIMDTDGNWVYEGSTAGNIVPYLWPPDTTYQGITSGTWTDNRINTELSVWVTSLMAMIGDMTTMQIQAPTIIAALNSIDTDAMTVNVQNLDYDNMAAMVTLDKDNLIRIDHNVQTMEYVPSTINGYHGITAHFTNSSGDDTIYTVLFEHSSQNIYMAEQTRDHTDDTLSQTLSGQITPVGGGSKVTCLQTSWLPAMSVTTASLDFDTIVSHGLNSMHMAHYQAGTTGLPNNEDYLGLTYSSGTEASPDIHIMMVGLTTGTTYSVESSTSGWHSGTPTADQWHYVTVQDADGNQWALDNGNPVAPAATASQQGLVKLAAQVYNNEAGVITGDMAWDMTGGWQRLAIGSYNSSVAGIDVTLGPLDRFYYLRYQGSRFSASEGYHGAIDQIYFTAGSNPVIRNYSHSGTSISYWAYIGDSDGLAHIFFDRSAGTGTHTFLTVDVMQTSTGDIVQLPTSSIATLTDSPTSTYNKQVVARDPSARAEFTNYSVGGIQGAYIERIGNVVMLPPTEGTSTSAITNAQTLWTLPVGFRPIKYTKTQLGSTDGSATFANTAVNINTAGTVIYYGDPIASGKYIEFWPVTWLTADAWPS
jgi:hypothetical protein